MNKKKKSNFIKKHEFPGGKPAFQQFILSNLIYPKNAIEHKIEGSVFLEYEVGFNGDVFNAKVLNGLGFGCDEEALRIIKLLKYAPQNNHGIKLISKHKVKINFKLPIEKKENKSTKLSYNITTKKTDKKVNVQVSNKNIKSYTYTIKF